MEYKIYYTINRNRWLIEQKKCIHMLNYISCACVYMFVWVYDIMPNNICEDK